MVFLSAVPKEVVLKNCIAVRTLQFSLHGTTTLSQVVCMVYVGQQLHLNLKYSKSSIVKVVS